MQVRVQWEYSYPHPIATDDGEVGIAEEWEVEEAVQDSPVYDQLHKDLKRHVADEIEDQLDKKPKVSLDGGLTEVVLTIDNRKISAGELKDIMDEAVRCFASEKYDVPVKVDLEVEDEWGNHKDVRKKLTLPVSPCAIKWTKL